MPRFVQFPVPEERVADVAAFLYGALVSNSEASPKHSFTAAHVLSLVERIYIESEPAFRRLLVFCAHREAPSSPVGFSDVNAAMGYKSSRQLPGALGAYGRRSKHRYDGYWPFKRDFDYTKREAVLQMEAEVATLIRDLHQAKHLPA